MRKTRKRLSRQCRTERWYLVHAAGCTYRGGDYSSQCSTRFAALEDLHTGIRIPRSMRREFGMGPRT